MAHRWKPQTDKVTIRVRTYSSKVKALIVQALVNSELHHCRVRVRFIVYCVSFVFFVQFRKGFFKQLRNAPTITVYSKGVLASGTQGSPL